MSKPSKFEVQDPRQYVQEQTEKVFQGLRNDLMGWEDLAQNQYESFYNAMEKKETVTFEDLNNIEWDITRLHTAMRETIDGIRIVVKLLSDVTFDRLESQKDVKVSVSKGVKKELKLWFKERETAKRAQREYVK